MRVQELFRVDVLEADAATTGHWLAALASVSELGHDYVD